MMLIEVKLNDINLVELTVAAVRVSPSDPTINTMGSTARQVPRRSDPPTPSKPESRGIHISRHWMGTTTSCLIKVGCSARADRGRAGRIRCSIYIAVWSTKTRSKSLYQQLVSTWTVDWLALGSCRTSWDGEGDWKRKKEREREREREGQRNLFIW